MRGRAGGDIWSCLERTARLVDQGTNASDDPQFTWISCAHDGFRGQHPVTRHLSYKLLEYRAKKISYHLIDTLAIPNGHRVAILAKSGFGWISYFFATPRSGLVLVPINERWSLEDMMHVLNDSLPSVLVFDHHFERTVDQIKTELDKPEFQELRSSVKHFVLMEKEDGVPQALSPRGGSDEKRSERAEYGDYYADFAIFYTSGTSSKPKGARISHESMIVQAISKCHHIPEGYDARTKYLHLTPLYHVSGANSFLAVCIARGKHVMYTSKSFSPDLVCKMIQEHDVTSLVVVPTMLQMMIKHMNNAEANFERPATSLVDTFGMLPSVASVLIGGNPPNATLLESTRDVFPNASIYEAYGMTEASSSLTFYRHEEPFSELIPGIVGSTPSHIDLIIVDENEVPAANGTFGEISVRGPCMFQGYWIRPKLVESNASLASQVTAASEHQGFSKDGWFRTGDLGYIMIDEQSKFNLVLVGRKKDMIKTGGENVYARQVESVLEKYPGVQACAVVGIKDKLLGERICAVVETDLPDVMALDEVQDFCTSNGLSKFQCPRMLRFVKSMPRSTTGKIQKRELLQNLGLDI